MSINPSLIELEGKTIFRALAATTKYLTLKEIEKIHAYGVNQPIIYRHEHPAKNEKSDFLGRVTKTELVDIDKFKGVIIEAEMFEKTSIQKKALEYIRLKQKIGDPIKVSVGVISYKEGEEAQPYEFSLTQIPVCTECAGMDVKTMENEKAIIAELEASLNAIKLEKEELQKKVNAMQEKEKKYLEMEDKTIKALETVKKEYEGKFANIYSELEASKKEVIAAKKAPYIKQLKELENDEDLVPWYDSLPVEKLAERVEKLKKRSVAPITVKTLEQTTREAEMAKVHQEMDSKFEKLLSEIVPGKGD